MQVPTRPRCIVDVGVRPGPVRMRLADPAALLEEDCPNGSGPFLEHADVEPSKLAV